MSNEPEKDAAYWRELRSTDPGIAAIGDRVIWDGQAEQLGIEPMKTLPPELAMKDKWGDPPDKLKPDRDRGDQRSVHVHIHQHDRRRR